MSGTSGGSGNGAALAALSYAPASAIEFSIVDDTAKAVLNVTNASSDRHAVLKVKTNAADRYVVKPHVALLKPLETRAIHRERGTH